MASALSRVLTGDVVKQLAGPASRQRGQSYVAGGNVRSLVLRGDTLIATVTGTREYVVKLAAADDRLTYRCSCPVGAEGGFCKHAVAVALSWLNASRSGKTKAGDTALLVTLDDLRPRLLQQPAEKLADLLLDVATRDDRLRKKLLREAARASRKGFDFSTYRKAIDRATRTGGFIDYGAAGGFAEGVREAAEPLRELAQEGQAATAVDLVEHALGRVEKALREADDSDGEIGSVLEELQELHLKACRAARPDPAALAARLFEWEIKGDGDVFFHAVETYAEVLGPAGVAVYRQRAEAAWRSLPALKSGGRESYDSRRFRVTSIMEALARVSGDLDALVAIKAKDLSHAYNYLQIAELHREAKRHDEALDWAERGLKAFPENTDARLVEFVAEMYHQRKRSDEAMALIWRLFEERPALEGYRNLKSHAARARAWPAWRERALAALRARIANAGRGRHSRGHPWETTATRSTLARILLLEKDVEAAWREAQTGEIVRELWLELAAAREATHPADALPILVREAEALIAQTNYPAYEAAVGHLKKVKSLHLRLDQADEWAALLARLRLQHKAKRNFIALAAKL